MRSRLPVYGALCLTLANVVAQAPSPLEVAKAIDRESRQLKDAPEAVRATAVVKLLNRIRQQPPELAVTLAWNLAVDHADGSDRAVLRQMADTLARALRDAPEQERTASAYRTLAELARYDQIPVSVDDLGYSAAMRELDREDKQRRAADFTLTDLDGNEWTLRALRGKVVLVNLWATWCPPCRKELPEIDRLQKAYADRGLVVVTLSDEERARLLKFSAEHPLTTLNVYASELGWLNVGGRPLSMVIDRGGVVRECIIGGRSYAEFEAKVAKYLEG